MAYGYNRNHQHSEISALNHLWPNRRVGTHVISLRITRGGVFGMARPCAKCQAYLRLNKVGKVSYFDGLKWVTERVR